LATFIRKHRSGPIRQGPVVGTIQSQINFSGNGDNILVAVSSGRIIRVHNQLFGQQEYPVMILLDI